MKVLNLKISPEVEAIIQNEKSRNDFCIVHIYGEHEKMRILGPHEYEITITKDTSSDIYLHEFMHCVQYETGFYKLANCHTHTARTKSIIGSSIQSFILDFYINKYLQNKYNFKVYSSDKKYQYYKNVIQDIDRNKILDDDLYNLFAIEISYIYWNIDTEKANELLFHSERLNDKTRSKFNQIAGIITPYQNPTAQNSKIVFNRLLQILELSDIFHLVCPLKMWNKNQT